MEEAVVIVSDMHINSVFGICKPLIDLDYGIEYKSNDIQKWLLTGWKRHLEIVAGFVRGKHSTLVLNGDIADLNYYDKGWSFITRNPKFALRIAIDLLEPFANMFDDVFVTRGTTPHAGQDGFAEESIADDLGAVKDPKTKAYSWRQIIAEFGGVTFDIAHHVRMGSLPWTYGNAAVKLAVTTLFQYADLNEKAPDVVVRSHQHRFTDSGKTFSTRGITSPAWQWPPDYLDRTGKYNEKPHIGSLLFHCKDGNYTFEPDLYKPPRRKVWKRK